MKWTFVMVMMVWLSSITAQERITSSEELGMVHWYRDYDQALAQAAKASKPVFLLFQEVPGCSTCRNYGQDVLSHPLVVEAIEAYCIPLAIYNNKGGADRAVLDKYKEPTWNNPVARIVDAQGEDLQPRIAGDYSARAVLHAIIKVLEDSNTSVPAYLTLAAQELAPSTKEDFYQMYCFWSGEQALGQIDGVVDVESGFVGGAEVVKVTYDHTQTSQRKITTIAEKHKIKPIAKPSKYRTADKDVHYYLRNSDYRYLPLSTMQQTKVNSAIGSGQNPSQYLSPRQVDWLDDVRAGRLSKASRYDRPFADAWWQIDTQASE
jgi:copper chaperone CopZ